MSNEPDVRTATQALDRYHRDRRFHALVQMACARGMQSLDDRQHEFDRKDIGRMLTETCAFLLEGIITEDAELNAMRQERDMYKKFAEETAGLRPMTKRDDLIEMTPEEAAAYMVAHGQITTVDRRDGKIWRVIDPWERGDERNESGAKTPN